jgi:hypothetical protein
VCGAAHDAEIAILGSASCDIWRFMGHGSGTLVVSIALVARLVAATTAAAAAADETAAPTSGSGQGQQPVRATTETARAGVQENGPAAAGAGAAAATTPGVASPTAARSGATPAGATAPTPPPPAANTPETPVVETAAPAAVSRPAPPPGPPPPPPVITPFRLGLTYTNVVAEDGELSNPDISTNAMAIDLGFASHNYIRNHLSLGHQWESAPNYSAKGFRIDLISVGFPIPIDAGPVRFVVEPVLTVLRGEIMFISGGGRFARIESGVGVQLSVMYQRWFAGVEPLAVDFRYGVLTQEESRSGFGRLFPLRIMVGHEF